MVHREDLEQVEDSATWERSPLSSGSRAGARFARTISSMRAAIGRVERLHERLGAAVDRGDVRDVALAHHEHARVRGLRIVAEHVEEGADVEDLDVAIDDDDLGRELDRTLETEPPIRGERDLVPPRTQRRRERIERVVVRIDDEDAAGGAHSPVSGWR